jgi:hypothetical protein
MRGTDERDMILLDPCVSVAGRRTWCRRRPQGGPRVGPGVGIESGGGVVAPACLAASVERGGSAYVSQKAAGSPVLFRWARPQEIHGPRLIRTTFRPN